jgi:two-component system, NtrC family, nitrogen regulation sensor histidine kinase NtrY
MDNSKTRGSRIIGGIIVVLIVLFLVIDYFIRQSAEFSTTNVTNILLVSLQIIVLLLALILFFVLGRNLIKLYLERKQKVLGAHFKTKLVIFFTALSFIPTLLLFIFTSRLINRNIEQWFTTPLDKILDDTKSVAEGFTITTSDLTLHYAQQLVKEIRRQNLLAPENRSRLEDFIRSKLTEYKLDEIAMFQRSVEQFTFLNPNLPLQDYQDLQEDVVRRAILGDPVSEIKPMGSGVFVRRGVSLTAPNGSNALVITGKFLPQNYAQKIASLTAFIERYKTRTLQKDLVKTLFSMMLVFVTLLIVFAAVWIGFHIAKSITVPIEKLALATKEVSKGNLAVRVDDPASDEIGILIESFNQMVADIKDGQRSIAQKTAESEARKQYIETVLNTINTGVIALDAQGAVAAINPSARAMLGLPGQDGVGRHYRELLGDARYRDFTQVVDNALKVRHRVFEKEIQLVLDGQQMTIALTVTPLRPSGQDFSGLIVVLDDLTQLIVAQKIAAWKEVAQRVAHEIKNPLTPIQLNAERIIKTLKRTEPGGNELIDQGARVIIAEAQTIKSLVDEFSDFARLPKTVLQPADIRDILIQVVTMFRGIFTEVQFDVVLAPDVPSPVQIDPDQMKRVLINLIDNAIDAMNKKGKIALRVHFDKEANQVVIDVTDTGPGIPVEDKDRMFLPHFSTKKKGTGLGLAIVNQIIKEHNGTVQAQNNRTGGATFTLRLQA